MFWRPRSIMQLVLLGFFIVLAPLCIAIFFTLQALDRQAADSEQMTRQLVSVTRQSQRLQADLVDLERLARQYATLGEERLLPLFERTGQRSRDELETLSTLLPLPQKRQAAELSSRLLELARGVPGIDGDTPETFAVLDLFDAVNRLNRELQSAVEGTVDQQLNAQALKVDELNTSLRNLVLLLASLTLIAALLFIYWIITPIRQIEREIKALGRGDRDRQILIRGPLEMRALGQQLAWLRGQLNQLDEQKVQFLRHMSHELKTPLASLREGADLMADGVVGTLDSAQQEVVAIIQQNSWELQRLIENLLDYNQALVQGEVQLRSVLLSPLCEELLEPYRMLIDRRNLQVEVRGPELSWGVDSGRLKTALDNLVSNAVNYCDSSGRILIEWQQGRSGLVIDVANSGEPISGPDEKRIFEPFFQGSRCRAGAIKGSGIGLSVARECIEAQGGSLGLNSKNDWNTCFRIELPVMEEAA